MPPLCARSDSAYSSTRPFRLRPTEGNALSAFAPYALRIPPPELAYSTLEIGRCQGLLSLPQRAYVPSVSAYVRGLYPLTIVSSISPVAIASACLSVTLSPFLGACLSGASPHSLQRRPLSGDSRLSRILFGKSCPFIGLSAGCRNHPWARSPLGGLRHLSVTGYSFLLGLT